MAATPKTQPVTPGFLPFQHPKLVDRPPSGSGWIHEVKFDGYRMEVSVVKGHARWFTRTGLDWSDRFPDFATNFANLPDCVLDGELCGLDPDGQQSFSALRASLGHRQAGQMTGRLVYYVFDLLSQGKADLRPLPLRERRARLARLLGDGTEHLALVRDVEAPSAQLFKAACAMGLEGIVSKQLDAPYQAGDPRPGTWLKVKCRPVEEVVIAGWRAKGPHVQKLLAGVYRGGQLAYVGGIAPGSGTMLEEVIARLRALETPASPFAGKEQPKRRDAELHFARPELVGRVEMAEWTASGQLRQASFKGLREDKPATDVVEEQLEPVVPALRPRRTPGRAAAEVLGVPISNPDKVLWPADGDTPAVTKLDLANYYREAAKWMLPYLQGRPCTVVAAPDGLKGPTTYVRHEGQWQGPLRTSALLRHFEVPETGKVYPGFDTVESLIAAADMALVEFHPWNSMPDAPMTPGRMVFDLDPDPGLPFIRVAEAAAELERRLLDYSLLSFVKTSGAKGLHVVAPFDQSSPPYSWETVKLFTQALCTQMVVDSPDRYTVDMRKDRRVGRIFLDYLRNEPARHAVGLLSPRATPSAPVSMPVDWKGLKAIDPKAFTVKTAPALMRKRDPWKNLEASARPLRYAIERLTDHG